MNKLLVEMKEPTDGHAMTEDLAETINMILVKAEEIEHACLSWKTIEARRATGEDFVSEIKLMIEDDLELSVVATCLEIDINLLAEFNKYVEVLKAEESEASEPQAITHEGDNNDA